MCLVMRGPVRKSLYIPNAAATQAFSTTCSLAPVPLSARISSTAVCQSAGQWQGQRLRSGCGASVALLIQTNFSTEFPNRFKQIVGPIHTDSNPDSYLHRIVKTLNHFSEYFGSERRVSLSREMSKIYEETVRGTIAEMVLYFEQKTPKGEFVIVVEGRK